MAELVRAVGDVDVLVRSLRARVSALAELPKGERPQATSLNATSNNKCVYGECDGGGVIVSKGEQGETQARNCRCVEMVIMKKRLEFANIPAEFADLTVKNFDTGLYQAEADRDAARVIKKMAIQYVKRFNEMQAKGKGLYMYGETRGSGKTRLAVSMGNALMTQYMAAVRFVTTLNLLEEIKSTWDAGGGRLGGEEQTQTQLLDAIKRVDVLILDDLGIERPSSWVNEMFYSILNDRMTANKITFFTSNCRVEDLRHDPRIVNRILKMALPVRFPEESVRAALARKENEDVLEMLLGGI